MNAQDRASEKSGTARMGGDRTLPLVLSNLTVLLLGVYAVNVVFQEGLIQYIATGVVAMTATVATTICYCYVIVALHNRGVLDG